MASGSLFAQLSGPLSGIITAGTYTVTDSISVSADDSLMIEPGTVFLFEGNFSFEVTGYLFAEGTEQDSIKFLPVNSGSTWKGITFYYREGEDSKLKYCRISGSNEKGITLYTSSPQISNCTISGNSSSDFGGGLYVINSSPEFTDCLIADNYADDNGGGIYFGFNSNPVIQNCVINGNSSGEKGAGMYFSSSSSVIEDCEISENVCSGDGGGLFCIEKSQIVITNCEIYSNSASNGGGINAADEVDIVIQNCDFYENFAGISGGAVYCQYASPSVSDINFHDNFTDGLGAGLVYKYCPQGIVENCDFIDNYGSSFAGLYIFETSADILNCNIRSNQTEFKGGGLGVEYSDAFISNCAIVDNSAGTYAGGIRIKGTDATDSPIITDCTIRNNHSVSRGGGLDIWLGQPTISHCIIDGNSSYMGGAIYVSWGANPLFENCTISGNIAEEDGSVIKNINSHFRMLNSIVEGNQGLSGIYFNVLATADINYNDFYDNTGIDFSGTVSPDLGQKVSVNANGDSCDIFCNFFENPIFATGSGDSAFMLTEFSPCIDAGDPSSPFDPDSTIADVGALWIGGTLTGGNHQNPNIPVKYAYFTSYPNPFNPATTLSFNLPSKSRTVLTIFDLQGRIVVKLMDDWQDAGAHSVEFNASNFPSGIYFARLTAGELNITQKLLLIK